MKSRTLFFTFFLMFFCACTQQPYPLLLTKPLPKQESPPYRLHTSTPIKKALYNAYKQWYGVKYCYGGVDKKGVDCSALVQNIYKDAFGIKVPRTTTLQAKVGYPIKKSEIEEGDLVLFKTSWKNRHSGIYLENGNFIHASSSHGVIISNLNNPYWKNKYWQTRRVLAR